MSKYLLLTAVILISGCVSTASEHRKDVTINNDPTTLTVGTVQREIKVGMLNSEVVSVLGAPNMVTTDGERREVWVYDRISTETAYSRSGSFGSILVLGASNSTGAKSTTQKTLTIIVKFDKQSKVRDFAYHSSKF